MPEGITMSKPIISDIDQFIEVTVRSGLSDREQLVKARGTLRGPAEIANAAIDSFCEMLVANGVLTPWQCAKLRKGQFKGFFFEKQYKLLAHLGGEGEKSVYLAFDLSNKRNVTLRISPPDEFGKHQYLVE